MGDQGFYEFFGGLFWREIVCFEIDLWVRRGFVGVVDTGEAFDLAGAGFFVEAFWVAGFANFDWGVDEDLEKLESGVLVDFADLVAVGLVGGDETRDCDDPSFGEEFGDFAHPADVFLAIVSGESEVVVEPVADIIAIEAVGEVSVFDEGVLEGDCDGGLSRARKPGEPEGASGVAEDICAVLVGNLACVPGDVV